jgi:nitrate ABC transporter ATP-binding subunit
LTRTQDGILLNPYLHFSDVTKEYPSPKGPVPVVQGFELRIARGEFISIIGHSGCGKSTVLMIAAGLQPITHGGIFLEGHMIEEPGPDRGVVFQSPSLFPWMTAMQNVMLGVQQVRPDASAKERAEVCRYYLEKVGLGDSLNRRASTLSVGMRQRVGIARAFALKPKLLLLDEPFGMLDSLTRAELQEILIEVWNSEKITAVMITHDVDEALFLSDRVVMMTRGPHARVGGVLDVGFERPRKKEEVIEHPDYYPLRGELIGFLEGNNEVSPRIVLFNGRETS